MTGDKEVRTSSPVHVHVDDEGPVVVHLAKHKKPTGRSRKEVRSV